MLIFNGEGGGCCGGKCGGSFGGRALNKDAKTEALNMIGKWSNLCQCRRPRTSFNSWTDWVLYQIRLCHNSTRRFPTINQPYQQQSTDPSNQPAVQLTTCLKANGPVSLQVGFRITNKLTNVLLHDILKPYTKVQVWHVSMSSYRNI